MRYFGKKSLSSAASGILMVSWYVVLAGSIIFAIILIISLFSISFGDPVTSEIAKGNFWGKLDCNDNQCGSINNWPLAVKIIILPYFGIIAALLLQIIKNSRQLFNNFKNDVVFNKSNAVIIAKISRINIVFSIISFNFGMLLVSVLLFILCEIFKKGSSLQEEHDLTV